ncbi:TRAP transporter substrate-binding protein DctP [Ornithinimicrobium cavernae]|uniref:TRAP transporter substrate-binding protein DctP n=1 Tax=Ornithinimicrobium cavernae TaxID=2666047 RepID=UPI0023516A25|nr:TRAP transporter substrate-binding protein DctP [Ornithinimicrobium cavernae]
MLTACSSTNDEAGADTPITIRVAHGYFNDSVEHEVLEETADSIRERTDGQLDLSVFSDNQLGTNADVVEQAVSGGDLIVFVDASGAAEQGVPEMGILSGPWLFDDVEQANEFSKSELFGEWTETLASEANLRILALNWFDAPRDIIGNAPYTTPESLNGTKLRLPPLDAWVQTFSPLGVTPTNLTYGETYGALQQGVVDGAESSPNAIYAAKWHEVAKHLTRTGHIRPWLGYAMGNDAFMNLSKEHQQILVEEFQAAGEEAAQRHADLTEENIQAMKDGGVQVHEIDVAAFREIAEEFYANSPNWEPGLVDEVRAAAGDS